MDNLVLDEDPPPPPAKMRKGIRPQSCKAKGRKFQQEIERRIKGVFPLEGNDVRSTSMGCSGSDLIMSPRALQYLPYDWELKNQERVQLWATLKQTRSRIEDNSVIPLVVIRKNRTKPVAVVPIVHYFHVVAGRFGHVTPDVTLGCLELTNGTDRPSKEAALREAVARTWDRWISEGRAPTLPVCSLQSLNFWDTIKAHWATGVVLNRGQADFPIVVALPWDTFETMIAQQLVEKSTEPPQ